MRYLFLIILVLPISCRFFENKKAEFKPVTEIFYISELTGVTLFADKKEESMISQIPYKSPLELTQIQEGDEWRQTTYQGKKGWVKFNSNQFLNYEPSSKYFQVVTRSGLNLREQPNVQAKVHLLLPEEATGVILEGYGKPLEIQKRLGIWLKVKYENKEGWIFSGFIKIIDTLGALNEKQLTGSDYFFLNYEKPYQLKSIDFKEDDLELNRAKITKYDQKYYTIIDVDFQPTKEEETNCIIPTFHRLIFQNKATGKYYETASYHSEYLKSINNPLADTVLSNWYGCWCCCPWIGNNMYFLLEDKILMIGYESQDNKAYCLDANIFISQPEAEKKYDIVNQKLYMFIRYPNCDERNAGKQLTEYSWEPGSYTSNLFVEIHFTGKELNIKRVQNKEIPKEYEEIWNQASKIPSVISLTKVPD